MKVVCCKNCGAKYQLEDNDDISTFECTSCAGELEYVENYSDSEVESYNPFADQNIYNTSYIVQCEDCGLKYKIKSTDSILDYECDSCGGSLRYLDEEMNKELDKYLEDRQKNIKTEKKESYGHTPTSEELSDEKPERSLKSFTNKIETFFSEEQMMKIADDERREEELAKQHSAKTTIPEVVLSKFGKEFAVPKTNDYHILKNFLKDNFYKSLNQYYSGIEKEEEKSEGFFKKFTIKEPEASEEELLFSPMQKINREHEDKKNLDVNKPITKNIVLIVGAIIFIFSIIEILTINSGLGIIALFIGLIVTIYGIYTSRNTHKNEEPKERKRIIRNHLLNLPNDFYVFYNVKIPVSKSSINHLVVGPSGIYALISKKYTPQINLESGSEELINSTELDNKIEEYETIGNFKRFRYTTKQAKFSKDNEIKQKALSLGEDLINFLNDNDIKNCFVEPLVGFVNNEVVVINTPLTDDDFFIDELVEEIKNGIAKLDQETIDKCAVLINRYSADCSAEL